jgi:hypothetical protein
MGFAPSSVLARSAAVAAASPNKDDNRPPPIRQRRSIKNAACGPAATLHAGCLIPFQTFQPQPETSTGGSAA